MAKLEFDDEGSRLVEAINTVAYEDSDTLGLTPQETEPLGKAAQEIEQVYRYSTKLLNQLTHKPLNHDKENEPYRRAV